jgi:hypothetical protein
MAVRNTKLQNSTTNWIAGDALYSQDLKDTFDELATEVND